MKKTITLEIPPQLDMLCNLLETSPETVIQGFINDLCQGMDSNGSDERQMTADYFLRRGYGMHLFDYNQVALIIKDLNQIRYGFSQFDNKHMAAYRKYVRKELKAWHAMWQKEKKQ